MHRSSPLYNMQTAASSVNQYLGTYYVCPHFTFSMGNIHAYVLVGNMDNKAN